MQLIKCPQCQAFHAEINPKCPACGAENMRSAQWSEEARQKFWAASSQRWEITKITICSPHNTR
jgi:ribosomal protein L37E